MFHDLDGAIHGGAFFIAGQQKADGTAMSGMLADEVFACGDHGRQTPFHVGGATAVQMTVAHARNEGMGLPMVKGTRRHYIGVAGEHEQRAGIAAPRPAIIHGAEA